VQTRAGLEEVSDHEADEQRHRRHDQEIAERKTTDLADLGGLAYGSDAKHDRAEDDRADHHLDQIDEARAERLEPRSEVRGEETYGDAGEHGQDDGDVQPMRAVPAWRGIGLCPSADRIAGAVPASGAGCSRALAG
jgi:hypothetical protein